MSHVGRVVLWALAGLFVLTAIVGILGVLEARSIVGTYTRASGVIADVDQGSSGDGGLEFTPIIRFRTVEGEMWEFRSSVNQDERPTRGSSVDVLYDAANPADAIEDSFAALWMLPLIILAIGVVGGLLMLVLIARGRSGRLVPASSQEPSETPEEPVEILEAMFSHVQPRGPDAKGRFQYRAVAVCKIDGVKEQFYSEWVNDDPTVRIMTAGNQMTVHKHEDGTATVVLDLD